MHDRRLQCLATELARLIFLFFGPASRDKSGRAREIESAFARGKRWARGSEQSSESHLRTIKAACNEFKTKLLLLFYKLHRLATEAS